MIWEQDDVDAYVAAADDLGHASLSLMILLEWEIGQRLTDVRGFRLGAEYDAAAGMFRFDQSKTGAYVTIQVSPRLRDLRKNAAGNQLFLFRGKTTEKAFTEERLSRMFAEVREKALEAAPGGC